MNRYKLEECIYLIARTDVCTNISNTLIHRMIGCMNVTTGNVEIHNYLIEEKLFFILESSGRWKKFCNLLCGPKERVLYNANMPLNDKNYPILELRIEISIGV